MNADDFWAHKRRNRSGCWLWTGTVNTGGYGQVYWQGRTHTAHRIAYELATGTTLGKLTVDHLCRTRLCINPEHLEAVTQAENNRRAPSWIGNQTHCKRGHPFEGINVFTDGKQRRCLPCEREMDRLAYRRKHPHARRYSSTKATRGEPIAHRT